MKFLIQLFAWVLVAISIGCAENAASGAAPSSELAFAVPQDGGALVGPTAVSVAGVGIVDVSFAVNDEIRFVDETEPFEWVLDPADFEAGTHVVRVSAKTESGAESVQARFMISPTAPPPPPLPTSSDLQFERATPEQVGIFVPFDEPHFTSPPPANATATVRFRRTTSSAWTVAHPLFRIHPEWNTAGAPVKLEDSFAGTIFGLKPGASYVVEVTVSAPSFGSVVLEGVHATRALPGTAGQATKTASSADDLQSIVDDLEPGDVLELSAGTYNVGSALQIAVSGTAQAPITIRGVNREQVTLQRSSGSVIQLTYASHIVLENMTLKGSGTDSGTAASSRGLAFWDGALQEFITVRNLDVVGVDQGVVAWGPAHSVLVYNCEFFGNNEWTNEFIDSNLTWNDDGIRLPGQGNCVFNNTMHGFGDTFAVNSGVFSAAVYFYRNRVPMTGDDAWEADYGTRNLAFYDNHIQNCGTLMSCDPVWGGPAYCFRNIAVNTARGPYKLNSEQSGFLIYNNTVIRTNGETDWGWVQFNNGSLRGWSYRNNLLVYQGGTDLMALESSGNDPIDFTHNGWYPDGDIWWSTSGSSGSSLASVRSQMSATSPLFGTSTLRHEFDVVLGAQPFATSIPLGSTHLTEITSLFVPSLGASSAARNAGTAIPNITDGHSGANPDMGAVMAGRANPSWGASR